MASGTLYSDVLWLYWHKETIQGTAVSATQFEDENIYIHLHRLMSHVILPIIINKAENRRITWLNHGANQKGKRS